MRLEAFENASEAKNDHFKRTCRARPIIKNHVRLLTRRWCENQLHQLLKLRPQEVFMQKIVYSKTKFGFEQPFFDFFYKTGGVQ